MPNVSFKNTVAAVFVWTFALSSAKVAAESLDAHVHGHAQLDISLDKKLLYIHFKSPAVNLVGFEHPPHDEQQQNAIADALKVLKQSDVALMLPVKAGCKIQSTKSDWQGEEDHDEHGHEEGHDEEGHDEHDHEKADGEEGGHSEFIAEYQFHCKDANALSHIDVLLFKQFPGIEEIDVQAILPGRQQAGELDADNHRIQLN